MEANLLLKIFACKWHHNLSTLHWKTNAKFFFVNGKTLQLFVNSLNENWKHFIECEKCFLCAAESIYKVYDWEKGKVSFISLLNNNLIAFHSDLSKNLRRNLSEICCDLSESQFVAMVMSELKHNNRIETTYVDARVIVTEGKNFPKYEQKNR